MDFLAISYKLWKEKRKVFTTSILLKVPILNPQCNRNLETRQKLCGEGRWYRAAVVFRLWRRRLIPETRVRSLVVTHQRPLIFLSSLQPLTSIGTPLHPVYSIK